MSPEEKGQLALARELNISTRCIRYIGSTDCSMIIKEGARLLQYNVILVWHPKHKSTVAYKHNWA